jgi:hypothetical protein
MSKELPAEWLKFASILSLDIVLYFGKDGEQLVVLLRGGTKQKQEDDIALARAYWVAYKREKRSTQWR